MTNEQRFNLIRHCIGFESVVDLEPDDITGIKVYADEERSQFLGNVDKWDIEAKGTVDDGDPDIVDEHLLNVAIDRRDQLTKMIRRIRRKR